MDKSPITNTTQNWEGIRLRIFIDPATGRPSGESFIDCSGILIQNNLLQFLETENCVSQAQNESIPLVHGLEETAEIAEPENYERTTVFSGIYGGSYYGIYQLNYTETETLDENGLIIEFELNLPASAGVGSANEFPYEPPRIPMAISNNTWVFIGTQEGSVKVAKEDSYSELIGEDCIGDWMRQEFNTTIVAGGVEWELNGPYSWGGNFSLRNKLTNASVESNVFTLEEGGRLLNLSDSAFFFEWAFAGMNPGVCDWIAASGLSEVVDLRAADSGITITWTNASVRTGREVLVQQGSKLVPREETMEAPAIKSIYVPRSSPVFEKLVG
ncbi:MAG: hypothetical protein AB1657_00850 [Candidatus Micrarchaeota archaeon]